jgi:tellurite resistance protein
MSSDWQRRGEGVVNAGIDFVSGMGGAFKSLGSRINRGRYAKVVEAFCAIAGDVASQNGRFLVAEREEFKSFVLRSNDNPVLAAYSAEELADKLKEYAVASFLGDEEKLIRAVRGVEPGSAEAQLVVASALAVAFADGECDARESACIAGYAGRFAVDLPALLAAQGLALPGPLAEAPPTVVPPAAGAEMPGPSAAPAPERQPLCKKCWAFLVAGQERCDCGRDLSRDYAVR